MAVSILTQMSALLLKLAGTASVRGTTTLEGMQVFSVYDFINLVCQKTGSYAHNIWSRMKSEDPRLKEGDGFKMEILRYQTESVSSTSSTVNTRNRVTPVMTLRQLQRLLLSLDNKVASEFREIVEGIFTRYMAGDTGMIEEIRSNSASDAPIHQAYRQALAQEPVADSVGNKRKVERQDALFELELKERNMSVIGSFCGLMSSLNPDWKNDTRLRLQLEDSMKTVMFGGQQALITNGEPAGTAGRSISVSQVAQELGVRLNHSDSIAIGRALAAQYREQHGEPPSKHRQWVDGAEREVNSYTERDRHLVERVVLAHTRK